MCISWMVGECLVEAAGCHWVKSVAKRLLLLWLGTQTRNTEHCNPKIKDVPYYCTGTKIFQKAQLSFWMQMVFDSCHIFPTFTAAWRLASQSVLKSSSPFKLQTTMSICKRPKQLQGGFCYKTAYVFATSFTWCLPATTSNQFSIASCGGQMFGDQSLDLTGV